MNKKVKQTDGQELPVTVFVTQEHDSALKLVQVRCHCYFLTITVACRVFLHAYLTRSGCSWLARSCGQGNTRECSAHVRSPASCARSTTTTGLGDASVPRDCCTITCICKVPDVWSSLWEGPRDPVHYLRSLVAKTLALGSWVERAHARTLLSGGAIDLSELFHPDTFLNAMRQQTARLAAIYCTSIAVSKWLVSQDSRM